MDFTARHSFIALFNLCETPAHNIFIDRSRNCLVHSSVQSVQRCFPSFYYAVKGISQYFHYDFCSEVSFVQEERMHVVLFILTLFEESMLIQYARALRTLFTHEI